MDLRGLTSGLLFCTLAALISLSGCGGGSNSSAPIVPVSPVFSSTPITAASEGTAYSYDLSATDPAGGAVTYSLTSAPAGAALNGKTVTWMPTAAQSRVANSFTVTATASKGGSAAQSWTVTPDGTIRVSWVDTVWGENGPNTVPFNWTPVPSQAAALVLQPNGTVQTLTGTGGADGNLTIPNVPSGYFWLRASPVEWYWTNSSSIDIGADFNYSASSTLGPIGQGVVTTLNFNVNGIEPVTGGTVQMSLGPSFQLSRTLLGNETSITSGIQVNTNIDWTSIKSGRVLEYKPVPMGTAGGVVLGPSATLQNLTLTNGGTNTINAELAPSPMTSLNLSIKGSAWAPLFDHVAPGPATPLGTPFSVAVEPDMASVGSRSLLGRTIQLLSPQSIPTNSNWNTAFTSPTLSNCSAYPLNTPLFAPPVLLTDTDFGTVQYGDPFPSTWTRYFEICQQAFVDVPGPDGGATQKMLLKNSATVAIPSAPVGPIIGPVEDPTINDMTLFKPATVNASAVTLKWAKPSVGNPTGYTIKVMSPITSTRGDSFYGIAAILSTATTSVTLPPEVLKPGKTYLLMVTAVADGRANMESRPKRTGVPMANAEIVSAPITIVAATP